MKGITKEEATLENYVADPDATICISKAELNKVLNLCKEN